MAEEKLETRPEEHAFEADVSRLLHMMVHSVYSEKDVFLRELISNAADACEKLRYEAIAKPELMSGDEPFRIRVILDEEQRTLTVEDNGIGMTREEMIDALGTIARSGTRAFMEKIAAANGEKGAELIGQFGVGFYSSFMVADRVEVFSCKAGTDDAWVWSSDGKGSYSVSPAEPGAAPARGTRVRLHLMEDAKGFTSKWRVETAIREQSGHVPVPIEIVDKPDGQPSSVTDGVALWTRNKNEIKPEEYTDFYRSTAGQYDDPLLTIHFRAEGRQEYTTLAFVPGSQPFDLFDPDRKGRMKLYVKRVFITDEAELVPRYLRFVRGIIDSADLPLNISREMIQDSPLLSAIRKGVTNRILTTLEKTRDNDTETYDKIWDLFGSVIKEGLYEDYERREQLLGLARFRTTATGDARCSLADYISRMKEGQDAIYYIAGPNMEQLLASPQLEGYRARGIEVLLLADPVDSFWAPAIREYQGKAFKSVTQGVADLDKIAATEAGKQDERELSDEMRAFIELGREELKSDVTDVRASKRLTESAVCLVADEHGLDRQLERILQGSGRLSAGQKPVLEINPDHARVKAIAGVQDESFRKDALWLLLDEARVLDGDRPANPKAFAERLSRVFDRALAR